ncbi:FadR/GntR family transcriptional regulator [Pseudonocardia sp. GCM10023141]|uniref:FadR/GntR family transcriptional regulator n=1 Tax=Pseudonocardia sp. GCM10023141 TaxID=3252653 RepID=UPI003607BF47
MSESFDPLRIPKAAVLAAESIRRRIVRGELRTDELLPPESELLRQFGISRPTLREAMRILESEGLISVKRGMHGGARVRAPDADSAAHYVAVLLEFNDTRLVDVHETQAVLEIGAVRVLAERAGAESVEVLRKLLDTEEDTLGDAARFNVASANFHAELVEQSGLQTMALMARMLSSIVRRHGVAVAAAQQPTGSRPPRWQVTSHDVHRSVLDLILVRDGRRASELWLAHARANHRATLAALPKNTVLDLFA